MIELVAFLGNYGNEYAHTRHNTAWLFAQTLDFYSSLTWQHKCKAELAFLDTGAQAGGAPAHRIYFVKPLTYMNLSGEAVQEAARFYKIPAEDVLVVHDEIELPLGTVSLKWSGGLGGHNGLRSVKACLGTADFWRLRFGVGKGGPSVADYVLSPFLKEEQPVLEDVFAKTAPLFSAILHTKNLTPLLSEWGKKKVA